MSDADEQDPNQGHSVSYSATTLTELMIPAYANFGGKIHGGTLLSLMDKVAYACASKHAGNYCVTVSVDNVHFLAPVEVGDLVSMSASINYVGSTSLVVGIRVMAENVQTRKVTHTNTSYFSMVAKDASGAKAQVPPLILESAEEVHQFSAALRRRRLRSYARERMQEYEDNFTLDDEVRAFLKDERCILQVAD